MTRSTNGGKLALTLLNLDDILTICQCRALRLTCEMKGLLCPSFVVWLQRLSKVVAQGILSWLILHFAFCMLFGYLRYRGYRAAAGVFYIFIWSLVLYKESFSELWYPRFFVKLQLRRCIVYTSSNTCCMIGILPLLGGENTNYEGLTKSVQLH